MTNSRVPAAGSSLRDRQRAQVRADIRHAAYRLFIEKGYDAVTVEEIAEAAGLSPRTVFRHVPTKEDLIIGPARHGGAAIADLLEQRPASEAADVALIGAITTRASSYQLGESEQWLAAIRAAPELIPKVTMLADADRDRIVQLVAERMNVNSARDIRPGLLVQLAFAAADYAFRLWVGGTGPRRRSFADLATESLEAVADSRWRAQNPLSTSSRKRS